MTTVDVDADDEFAGLAGFVGKFAKEAATLIAGDRVEVALRLMGDDEMRALNRTFRGKDATTDVLSFDGEGSHLGDVAISVPVATRQAKELGHDVKTELRVLVVHALVHLSGFDHERSDDEARLQAEVEMGLLDALGVPVDAALSRRGL